MMKKREHHYLYSLNERAMKLDIFTVNLDFAISCFSP